MDILIGADPEVFVSKDKKFHSAYNLVPGTKKAPFPVPNGAVQVDGMALEFNIAPANSQEMFLHNIESVLSTLKEMVPKEYKIENAASVKFDRLHMDVQPKEALILGCDADFDAYNEEQSPPPIAPKTMRSAGGHIHIGWTNNEDPMESSHFLSCCQIAKQLDFFLGIPSMLLDKDVNRRELYGRAGNFRPKPYGMEYRVLSNFWIFDKEYIKFIFNQTKQAFNEFVDGGSDYFRNYGRNAQDIINHNDAIGARHFLEHVPQLVEECNIESLKRGEIRGMEYAS